MLTIKNAEIDYRFDSFNNIDIFGQPVNSEQEINSLLYHLKSIDYNTVTLNLDVPIDMRNGLIDLGNLNDNSNKDIPKDIWKSVAYAHSIGLSVYLKMIPCVIFKSDGTLDPSDTEISTINSIGDILKNNLSIDTVFQSITDYETKIAKLAQKNGVEGFYIGSENVGYDASTYLPYWQTLVNSVKQFFTGSILYEAAYDNAIFSIVDTVAYVPNPVVSTKPIYNLAQIVEAFYHTPPWTQSNQNYIDYLTELSSKYSNKAFLLNKFCANSANPGIGNTFFPFSLLVSDASQLSSLPQPNYVEQSLAYQAMIYVADYLLSKQVKGIGLAEYDPWALADWLQNPKNAEAQLWNLMDRDSWDLINNPTTEAAIKSAFLSNPLPNFFFSTPTNDVIKGNADVINTSVFYSSFSTASINLKNQSVIVSSTADGTDTLTNIQRLQFSDVNVALDITGNAGTAAKIIGAVFGKDYLSNKQYMGFCLHLLDNGTSNSDLARIVLNAAHLTTNDEIVSALLKNVYGTTANAPDKASLLDMLNKGTSISDLVLMQANTAANISNINLDGLAATGIQYSDYENHTAAGTVTITGTATQGQILTALNNLSDLEGLGNINYQWQVNGVNINGATGSTLKLDQTHVGKAISVVASYFDGFGTTESVSSNPTSNVVNLNDLPTGNVIITGTATQNQTLSASNTLADADGLGAISYQWLRDGNAISNATQSTYVLTQADVGKKISIQANYVDGFGTTESVSSNPTSSVIHVNSPATGNVNISGSTFKGQLLTASNTLADTDGLGTISYQWLNNGVAIPNATQPTYKLTQADTEQNISVKANYTDLQNTPESVASNSISVASNSIAIGTATIKGTSTYGSTLSINNTIKDADGLGKLSYTWQSDKGTLSTSATYTLAQTDVSTKVWAIVSYTDKKGSFEEVKSNVIDVTVSTKPSALNDILTGTDAADKLNGLAGNDTLIGGLGKDTLTGGAGADVFKFNSVSDSSPLSKQADVITDFKHAQGDKIDLSAIDANSVLINDQAFIYIGTTAFSADATGQLRFDVKTSTLYGSTNSDPAPEFAIVLSGVKSLVAEDFIL